VVCDKLHSFAIEFTDHIFIDHERESVLISFSVKYLNIIESHYKSLGYSLVHMTSFKNDTFVTCVFLKDC